LVAVGGEADAVRAVDLLAAQSRRRSVDLGFAAATVWASTSVRMVASISSRTDSVSGS